MASRTRVLYVYSYPEVYPVVDPSLYDLATYEYIWSEQSGKNIFILPFLEGLASYERRGGRNNSSAVQPRPETKYVHR